MDEDKKLPPCVVHDQAAAQFKTTLRRLTTYGGASREGAPARTTRASLSKHSNVKPSTLSTYLTPIESEEGRKPGLDKLCRLAEALGLPPAFLVMSADDWSRLLAGVQAYVEAITGPGRKTLEEFQNQTIANQQYRSASRDVVRDATKMAAMIFGNSHATEHASSIAANSLAIPLAQLDLDVRGLALAIAAQFGTSASKSKFMGEQVEQDSKDGAD